MHTIYVHYIMYEMVCGSLKHSVYEDEDLLSHNRKKNFSTHTRHRIGLDTDEQGFVVHYTRSHNIECDHFCVQLKWLASCFPKKKTVFYHRFKKEKKRR